MHLHCTACRPSACQRTTPNVEGKLPVESHRAVRAQSHAALRSCVQLDASWKRALLGKDELQGRSGVVVALGKFDAMHTGHRSLAEQATQMGGYPCLLTFWGMASVLNLPARQPLTADVDRPRVLRSWAPFCEDLPPILRSLPFADVRHLEPDEFIQVLSKDLHVSGVVAGANYRFGYKARGHAEMLQTLGKKHGLDVSIVELRPPCGLAPGIASSTEVRRLVASGEVASVHNYLDRRYSLLVPAAAAQEVGREARAAAPLENNAGLRFNAADAANEVPADGSYEIEAFAGVDGRAVGVKGRVLLSGNRSSWLSPVVDLRGEDWLRIEFVRKLPDIYLH